MTLSGSKGVKNGQKMLKKATNLVKNSFFEKIDLSPNFGFFQNFLALFDTLTTRYSNSGIKFEFSDQFQ